MADNQVSFADVQSEITKLVNSNTASNNAISAQLKEVTELIVDFNKRAQEGDTPSQADFQSAIAQLQAARSMVDQNTAEVQASTSAIQEADPAPSNTNISDHQPIPTGGTDSTSVNMGSESSTGEVHQSGAEATQVVT